MAQTRLSPACNRIVRIMKAIVSAAIALSLSACAATVPGLKGAPPAYRAQVQGLLSGRIDPWDVNPGEWGRSKLSERAGTPWAPRDKNAYDAWQVLATEVSRREKAEGPAERELWQGSLRMCHAYRTMILSVHMSPSSWASSPTSQPQFTPARDRVRQKFAALHAAEAKISLKGPTVAQAEARLARSLVFKSPPYAGPDETGESNYFGYFMHAEQCRVQNENILWIDEQLRKRTMVTGGDVSPRAVRATFALLHQSGSKSSILIRWLPLFDLYAVHGVVDANDYARSVDNILISTEKPQKYGSYQTCRGEIDRRNVHSEGPEVAREVIVANRATLKLPPLETLEAATRDHCARTYPFSM